jgi:hypothetical protein
MGGLNQNENLILIEDENETNGNENWRICGNTRKWKCVNKNSKVEKKMELIMILFCRIYMFKEKFIEAMIEMFYVFLSRK